METSASPFEQPGLSPTRRPSAPRESTCIRWAHGVCPKTAADCENAHHLFPQVVYRAAKKGVKRIRCVYGTKCFWPPEYCGFSHDERESGADEPVIAERQRSLENVVEPTFHDDATNRRMEVKDLLSRKEWDVELKYVCRRQDCTATFDDLAELLKHQERIWSCPQKPIAQHSRPNISDHEPESPSPSKARRTDKDWWR